MYNITIFNTKDTKSKIPKSPFDDLTFIFQTFKQNNLEELYNAMVSNFILNLPLDISRPIRTFRRKKNLEEFYFETINYFILDLDEVKTDYAKNNIIDYFKNYKCILGESRSYNGFDNFNLKGFIACEELSINELSRAISNIAIDLKDFCVIDNSVSRKATLNAPILKKNIFLKNEDGILYKFVDKEVIDKINLLQSEYQPNLDNISFEEETIDNICLKIFSEMGYEAIRQNSNGSIQFKHSSEKKSVGGYFWFRESPYTMHHNNSIKTVNIFETVRKIDRVKHLFEKQINYDSELLSFNTNTKVTVINQDIIKIDDEIKSKIDTFLNAKNGLLSIKSPMGTGKSIAINSVIEEASAIDMSVLIITNRISVAQDFSKKYNMKLYNSDKYDLGDSLVVQFDSLWRFNIKYFDIVIMDEFISLMLHSRNNVSNNPLNIGKFFACFQKKLVIADAFLTGYENFLLNNKVSNLHSIQNDYRDPTTLYSYNNKNAFIDNLLLHSNKKITVSSTSISFINSLKLCLENKGKKVVTLTADTPESTKKLIYGLFEQDEHDKWDVLIYSPTLTVGVSNMNNVDYHFHYDSSKSVDVISSLQMIKRTRKAKEIHYYLAENKVFLQTNYNQIRDEYIKNVGKGYSDFMFEIDNYGETRLTENGKKSIKIDVYRNILEFNHKNAFNWLLKCHFLNEPIIIDSIKQNDILSYYNKQSKENEKKLNDSKLQEYLSLNNIELNSLQDIDSDKVLKRIYEIDNYIDSTPKNRIEILKIALKNKSFIEDCRKYSFLYNYLNGLFNDDDIQIKINNCIINNKDDIIFYKKLKDLKHNGNMKLLDFYSEKTVKENNIKYIISNCGYSYKISGNSQGYVLDENVKKYFRCIL